MYVLVRRDQTYGQIVVQAGHAAIEAARQLPSDLEHPHLIVCGVKDEIQLEKERSRLEASGVLCRVFREPDVGNQMTAFSTEPIYGERRDLFRRYQLVKPPRNPEK